MSIEEDLALWHRELQSLLNAIAEATRDLGIARGATGVSDSVTSAAADRGDAAVARIATWVRRVNAQADALATADPTLADVVHPPLGVPGDAPVVQLRPWWSRLLDMVSSTAQRTNAVEQLETLRLEADAALQRATSSLARRDRLPS